MPRRGLGLTCVNMHSITDHLYPELLLCQNDLLYRFNSTLQFGIYSVLLFWPHTERFKGHL